MTEKLLLDAIKEIFRFNNFLKIRSFSTNDMQEEKENFDEFLQTQEKLQQLLLKLVKTPINNEEEFTDYIFDFHLRLSDFSWYFWNLEENLEKLIRAGADQKLLDRDQIKNVPTLFEKLKKKSIKKVSKL